MAEAEHIKKEDAVEAVWRILNGMGYSQKHNDRLVEEVSAVFDEYPAVDVRPVVKARLIGYPECLKYTNAYSDDHIVCSACEECFSILDNDCERFNFCPNCGAQMIGGDEDV